MKKELFLWMIVLVWLLSLTGCKEIEYVPVETVRTETVHQTDTVEKVVEKNNETNTIIREARPEDSLMLAKLGIKLQSNERMLILLQRELAETKNELKESHSKDSVRSDTVQVPYPVEKHPSEVPSNFVPLDSGLQSEDLHPARGIAGSGFRPLPKILDCSLP